METAAIEVTSNLTKAFPTFPTSPKALITLSLLSNGRSYHEKEIEDVTKGNRASDYISTLREAGWIISTSKVKSIKGSSYQLLQEQVPMAETVDITKALETISAEHRDLEVPSFDDFPLTSQTVISQLNLFQPSECAPDPRWHTQDLVGGAIDMCRKAAIQLLSSSPTKRNIGASTKVSMALGELLKAVELLVAQD
jgi:predicted transcriptional regulator